PSLPLPTHAGPAVLPDRNRSLPVCTEFTKLAAGADSAGKVMFSDLRRASAPAGACADPGSDNASTARLAVKMTAKMAFMSDLQTGSRKRGHSVELQRGSRRGRCSNLAGIALQRNRRVIGSCPAGLGFCSPPQLRAGR